MAYLIAPSFVLLAGLITDLRSRKIYNLLVGICALVVIASTYFLFGTSGLQNGLLSSGMALVLTLPLVVFKILGGGDLKLFVVFGFATSMTTVMNVLIYSLFWGAIIGIGYAIYSGQATVLFSNLLKILKGTPRAKLQLQKIPYTVPLVLAWFTYVALHLLESQGGL